MAKTQGLDLIKLYAQSDTNEWNIFLSRCAKAQDIKTLVDTMNGLQVGMRDLAKQRMNTEAVCIWYTRLLKSIENTLKKIWRDKHPNRIYSSKDKNITQKDKDNKKQMDIEFEKFLRRNSY